MNPRHHGIVAFALVSLATVLLAGQTYISDADVDLAIAAGQKGRVRPIGCDADVRYAEAVGSDFNQGYSVVVNGPLIRIANRTAEAKQKYLPFTKTDVTDEMKLNTFTVIVSPDRPVLSNGRWRRAAPATHFVIKTRPVDKKVVPEVIQPLRVDLVPAEWSNALGMKIDSQGLVAVFDAASVPTGIDLDFVVITDQGERDCTLKSGDRANVR